MFLDFRGLPARRNPVEWANSPTAVALCEPFTLAVVDGGSRIQVHDVGVETATARAVQTIDAKSVCGIVGGLRPALWCSP